MSICSFTHNRRGMALIYIVFIFIFISVLATAGLKMYGSIVTRGMINNSKESLENQVKMIVAWAAKNGHLPASEAEYTSVFGGAAPLDAWGRQIAYIYDDTLAVKATGGLCGRTSSILQDSGTYIAFALVSGGEDAGIQTTVNGTVVTAPIKDVIGVAPQNLANHQSDLYRAVPLEEMKSKAGCYGPTGGRLAIVNNELPSVCVGGTYNATVFATGGVPDYSWNVLNAPIWLPSGITTGSSRNLSNSNIITSTASGLTFALNDSNSNTVSRILPIKVGYTGACASSLINCASNTPPNCSVACVADPACAAACAANPACAAACAANPACKAACIADPVCKAACPACIASSAVPAITFNNPPTNTVSDNWNGGQVTDTGLHSQGSKIDFILDYTNGTMTAISGQNGTSTNCIWYQDPLTLTGKKLRAYFGFSIQLNQGFAFVLMPAQGRTIATNSCNPNANDDVNNQHDSMGFGPGIPGYGSTLIGVEFPAFDFSTCVSTNGVQCDGTPNSWLNNGSAFNVRIELDATVSPYILKEWLCPVGNGSCSSATITALQDLSTPYNGSLPYVTSTLTGQNLTDLSQFFIGFTTSQQGNDQVSLVLSGLKFGLY